MTGPQSTIHIELEGTPEEVRAALLHLRSEMQAGNKPQIDIGTLEIVLAEVLNNVVEHAFDGFTQGNIALTCDHDDQGWQIKVRDNGHPMPGGTLPAGIPPRLDQSVHDMPEGGFGWSLVRTLTRDLCYRREGECNVVTFRVGD